MHRAWEEFVEDNVQYEKDTTDDHAAKKNCGGKRKVRVHSLKYLAMRRLLSDQRLLDKETFRAVPWILASEVWDCLGMWYVPLLPNGCITMN